MQVFFRLHLLNIKIKGILKNFGHLFSYLEATEYIIFTNLGVSLSWKWFGFTNSNFEIKYNIFI